MKIQTKIASVSDDLEQWQDFNIVVGYFEDGSKFKAWGKDLAKAQNTRNELAGQVGIAGEFEIDETKTKTYQGRQEYRLKGWPGKPERAPWTGGGGGGGGFGGKKEFVPRYKDTMAGVLAEQDSIHRSVALQWAVTYMKDSTNSDVVLGVADKFYQWLSKDRPVAVPEPTQPAPLASPGPPQHRETIGEYNPLKDQKEFFGVTTGDKIKSQTVQKYLDEFEKAVKAKDADRVEKLAHMVGDSLEKKTVTVTDIEHWLEPEIVNSRKALKSAEEYDKWYARRLQEAQNKERHAESPF